MVYKNVIRKVELLNYVMKDSRNVTKHMQKGGHSTQQPGWSNTVDVGHSVGKEFTSAASRQSPSIATT